MLESAARIASLMLAAIFVWASVAKLVGRRAWSDALRAYGLGSAAQTVAAVVVPLAEMAAALLLVSGRARPGAALSLLLVSAFSLAVVRAQARSGAVPCGCFGRAEARDHRVLLARNALLGALAGVVLLAGSSLPGPAVASARALPATLAAGGVLLTAWVVRSARAPLRRRGER